MDRRDASGGGARNHAGDLRRAILRSRFIVVCIIGNLLLHFVAITLLLDGTRGRSSEGRRQIFGQTVNEAAPSSTLVDDSLVFLPLEHAQRMPLRVILDLRTTKITPVVPTDLNFIHVEPDPPEIAVVDERLRWSYSARLQSLIQSRWRKPRTPIGLGFPTEPRNRERPLFRCDIEITLERDGSLQQLRFPYCSGAEAWQRSLLSAIQQAAPFPSPPKDIPNGYVTTLHFAGTEYRDGSDPANYEAADPSQ